MRKTIILAAIIATGVTSAAVAQQNSPTGSEQNLGGAPGGISGSENSGMESGRSSGTDQSGTHDTGISTDQKLNVGPGAKSPLPPPASSDR